MNSSTLVSKLWNYCNVPRDDGMSYGDGVKQLTCLLFLKMADERGSPRKVLLQVSSSGFFEQQPRRIGGCVGDEQQLLTRGFPLHDAH